MENLGGNMEETWRKHGGPLRFSGNFEKFYIQKGSCRVSSDIRGGMLCHNCPSRLCGTLKFLCVSLSSSKYPPSLSEYIPI